MQEYMNQPQRITRDIPTPYPFMCQCKECTDRFKKTGIIIK